MKNINILSVLLVLGLSAGQMNADFADYFGLTGDSAVAAPSATVMPQPSTAVMPQTDGQVALNTIQKNVPVIVEQARLVVAGIQKITDQAATAGFWSSLKTAFTDTTTRGALTTLMTTLAATVPAVTAIASADQSIKVKAFAALAALRNDPSIQKLLEQLQQLPFGGSTISGELQQLMNPK
jgi:hypothetical protein